MATTRTAAAKPAAKTTARTTTARAAAPKPVARPAARPAARTVAAKAAPVAKAKKAKPEPKKAYKLLTGIDDAVFCQRVSDALKDGYELYGSPAITFNGKNNIVAQAVVLKKKPAAKKKKK
ncbi:MAG: hypothetical protein RLZ71_789 [Actinomycetota bacterium]|jgi:hypothetical protein